jgi:hypothetical protein
MKLPATTHFSLASTLCPDAVLRSQSWKIPSVQVSVTDQVWHARKTTGSNVHNVCVLQTLCF